MTITRILARPLLSSMFVVGGIDAALHPDTKVEKARKVTDKASQLAQRAVPQAPIPSETATLVRINGVVQVAAGIGLAAGKAPRLCSALLAATLVPTTTAGHPFWEESDPAMKANQKVHFFKNLSMLGGLLLASVDTEGKPGVAWRARRAAGDARREARHLKREAALQGRLTAKSVG
ncbi:MAG: DoxX family protein [Marmoricola sp.]